MVSSAIRWSLISLIVGCWSFTIVLAEIRCLDNNNKPVDWFIVYKLPRLEDSKDENTKEGFAQMYMDEKNQDWTLLREPITSTKSHAVYNTLQQIYDGDKKENVAYIMYNDGPAPAKDYDTYDGKYGHTKGDVCFDKSTGFWLVHSVPHFPTPPSHGYVYPDSGGKYGQTFMCVTYKYAQFNDIGKQLFYNYPNIYAHKLPEKFVTDNKYMDLVVRGTHVRKAPWNNTVTLTSEAGQEFISFAKYRVYGRDLYDAWVAPYFGSALYVETWQYGNPLPSSCDSKYNVYNVDNLRIGSESFANGQDHAKWAVTDDAKWICFGGINREVGQFGRAGGTVCSHLPKVAKVFKNAIKVPESCDENNDDDTNFERKEL